MDTKSATYWLVLRRGVRYWSQPRARLMAKQPKSKQLCPGEVCVRLDLKYPEALFKPVDLVTTAEVPDGAKVLHAELGARIFALDDEDFTGLEAFVLRERARRGLNNA